MISRFQSVKPRGRSAILCPAAPATGPAAPIACPMAEPAAQFAGPSPLLDLLAQLRGRPVTLLVGGHMLCGRVLSVEPLLLTDGEGKAIQVDPARIQSCQF